MQGTLTRRRFAQAMLAFAALAAVPLRVFARNDEAFAAVNTDEAMKALFGDKPMTVDDSFEFKVPDIAEDGSIVPVTVSTEMEGVKSISLNGEPLSDGFVPIDKLSDINNVEVILG